MRYGATGGWSIRTSEGAPGLADAVVPADEPAGSGNAGRLEGPLGVLPPPEAEPVPAPVPSDTCCSKLSSRFKAKRVQAVSVLWIVGVLMWFMEPMDSRPAPATRVNASCFMSNGVPTIGLSWEDSSKAVNMSFGGALNQTCSSLGLPRLTQAPSHDGTGAGDGTLLSSLFDNGFHISAAIVLTSVWMRMAFLVPIEEQKPVESWEINLIALAVGVAAGGTVFGISHGFAVLGFSIFVAALMN